MPLLKISESKKITIYSTIEETTVKQIEQYAAMIKGTVDEVVQQALEYVFSKDADFKKFCTENPDARPKEPVRVKRASSTTSTLEGSKDSAAHERRTVKLSQDTRSSAATETVLRTGRRLTIHPF